MPARRPTSTRPNLLKMSLHYSLPGHEADKVQDRTSASSQASEPRAFSAKVAQIVGGNRREGWRGQAVDGRSVEPWVKKLPADP